MKIHQPLWAAALLALASMGPAWPSQDDAQKGGDPKDQRSVTVIAVRHAEKGADDPRDPGLTDDGEERAAALAKLLAHAGVTHLYSTSYRRTQATVAPLATSLELEITSYDPRGLTGFAEDLRKLSPGSVAVVSGHSNTTPGLVLALGGEIEDLNKGRGGPTLGEDEYDRLFLVTLPGAEGLTSCVELRYGE